MNFWDNQFATPGYKYGTQPNAFLVAQSELLAPKSEVLLPGDGEGRNSVWLARRGHVATSLDSSRVGLRKARELAQINKVTINTLLADLEDWTAPTLCFDAVVLTYLHLPAPLRKKTHQQLISALRPGGLLILEAFHPNQLGYRSGGPKDHALLYTLDILRSDLGSQTDGYFHEVLAWEGESALDEGPGHQGPAYLTRYIARRVAS